MARKNSLILVARAHIDNFMLVLRVTVEAQIPTPAIERVGWEIGLGREGTDRREFECRWEILARRVVGYLFQQRGMARFMGIDGVTRPHRNHSIIIRYPQTDDVAIYVNCSFADDVVLNIKSIQILNDGQVLLRLDKCKCID